MTILLYIGPSGSDGYVQYCRGITGKGRLPEGTRVILVVNQNMLARVAEVDEAAELLINDHIGSPWRIVRLFWHLIEYPFILGRIKPNVEFYTSGFLPLWRHVFVGKAKVVTICHTLLPFDKNVTDETGIYGNLNALLRKQVTSIKRSSGIIFLSGYSRRIIQQQCTITKPMAIIPHGVDQSQLQVVNREYILSDPAEILCISSLWPYKNLANLICAFSLLRKRINRDLTLKVIGSGPTGMFRHLQKTIVSVGVNNYVMLLGVQPHDEVQRQLRSCDVFVFPSSCETFGIPLLEAMAASLPIACSDRSGLPAVLGSAGLYFDPSDSMAISESMYKLLTSQRLRERLGKEARRRAMAMPWERCASETYSFLHSLLNRKAASLDDRNHYQ